MTQRILIVGAGFAGMWSALAAARGLDQAGRTQIDQGQIHRANGSVEIVLVAPEPFLHVRPRLYETNASGMTAPLTDLFDAVGVRYVQGRVVRISTGTDEVEVIDAKGLTSTLAYDRLVLAAGSRLFRPDIPGLDAYGFSVDQLDEAAELEAHIKALAGLPDTPARNTIVVAGGGFTGIETATEMPARLRAAIGDGADIKVIVVEQADEIGPDLGPGPRPVIQRALTELGISWQVNTEVTAIDAGGLSTSRGDYIPCKTVIWTAGARASTLTEQVRAERDRYGRLHVDRDLRVIGVDHVYATGDVARAATDDDGHHSMMSCQHAMNLGRFAGHNVAADLLGLPSQPYSQPRYVTCLDLGPWGAVYTEGWNRQVKLIGAEAKALKRKINTQWIYPPRADRTEALASAEPKRLVIA